ncbi:hypothetical protein FACS1894187_19210 [Synergistales bacterium]|nr:hypothetical protein FACS1894187_19210 [Synergistales bacterium]
MAVSAKGHLELGKFNLRKAKRAWQSAFVLLGDADLDGAINRVYYALYHVEKALLHTKGVGTIGHIYVRKAFTEKFANDGCLPDGASARIGHIQSLRTVADYSEERSVTEKELETAMCQTKLFLQIAEKVFGDSISVKPVEGNEQDSESFSEVKGYECQAELFDEFGKNNVTSVQEVAENTGDIEIQAPVFAIRDSKILYVLFERQNKKKEKKKDKKKDKQKVDSERNHAHSLVKKSRF